MKLELSPNAERSLKKAILDLIARFLDSYTKPAPRVLGLMNRTDVAQELGVSKQTLKRWEDDGLRPYSPPMESSKATFYKVSDLLEFLGVEE